MSEANRGFWKRRWKWLAGFGAVAAAVLILLGARLARPEPSIPTAEVTRGTFMNYLTLRGEVKARRSVTMTAPRQAGQLLIVKLAPDGTLVKKGDVVVQFDASKLEQNLAEHRSTLETVKAQIQHTQAQARITEQQDLTDLSSARFTLKSAQLDASKSAILSEIDGKEAELKVADAELALKQAEKKLRMDRAAATADLADQKEKENKASFDVKRDETALSQMSLRAALDGVVTVLSHWTPNGPQPYRLGDQVWSGATIAELPDLSTLYFDARADEIDRSRLKVSQAAQIRVDALPGQQFSSRIHQISTLASLDFTAPWPFPRNFEVEYTFDHQSSKLRPGMSANARTAVGKITDAIQIPTRAVFQKNGRPVAFALRGSKFQVQPIETGARNEDRVVITAGLKTGDRVALEEPGGKD